MTTVEPLMPPEDPEREARINLLTRGMVFAFTTGTEMPFMISTEIVRSWAEVLDSYGWRQTDEVAAENIPPLPQWLRQAAEEQASAAGDGPVIVDPADAALPEGLASVATAPPIPKRIPKSAMGG